MHIFMGGHKEIKGTKPLDKCIKSKGGQEHTLSTLYASRVQQTDGLERVSDEHPQ